MHRQKTGALIQASVLLGAIAAGRARIRERAALAEFGAEIGLAFQIQDDILDVEGTTTALGKRAGADADRVKPTYPSVLGLAKSRARGLSSAGIARLLHFEPLGLAFRVLARLRDIFSWRAATEDLARFPPGRRV